MPSEDDHLQRKEIETYVVIDYRDESIRTRKTEPTDLSPYEIVIETSFTVVVPDLPTPELSAELRVPEPKVEEALAEQFHGEVESPDEFVEVGFEEDGR
jgi:hypothetical protein